MPLAAAILGAGAIGGGLIAGSAAKSAAKTQANAATQAAQLQMQQAQLAAQLQLGMFNTIRGDLAPYRTFGQSALPGISMLMGLPQQNYAAQSSPTTNLSPGAFTAGGLTGANPDSLPLGVRAAGTAPGGGFTGGGLLGPGYGGDSLIIPGINDQNTLYGGLAGGQPAANGYGGARLTSDQVQQIMKDRPDVMAAYQSASTTADRNSPAYMQAGLDSPENFINYWYNSLRGPAGDKYEVAAPAAPPPGPAGTPQPTTLGGQTSMEDYLQSLPGYQFARDQGMQAVQNTLGARGLGGLSGSLGKGLARFVTGLADQTYGEQLDRMFRVAGVGQNAAVQTGAAGTSAASGAAGALTGGAAAGANGIIGAANASAGGTIGAANALSGGLTGAANSYLTSRVLGMYGAGGGGGAAPQWSAADLNATGLY